MDKYFSAGKNLQALKIHLFLIIAKNNRKININMEKNNASGYFLFHG